MSQTLKEKIKLAAKEIGIEVISFRVEYLMTLGFSREEAEYIMERQKKR